jgi:23S rRNA pseudouridine1911/1915/1917 synthase
VQRWIDSGLVLVDGRRRAASHLVRPGSEIVIAAAPAPGEAAGLLDGPTRFVDGTSPFALRILAERGDIIAVDKPAGVHCERGRSRPTLVDLLEARYEHIAGIGDRESEGGLAHRLDRDTSGVLLAARSREAWLDLRRAFRRRRALKHYLALVSGRMRSTMKIDAPLARRTRRMVAASASEKSIEASTAAEPLEAGDDWTLVLATMSTGAMHQIRAHLALAGHPLIGDALYDGPRLPGCPRDGHLLHALRVRIDGRIDATAPAPADFTAACALLRRGSALERR